jgi:hypothetical protein
MPLRSPVSTKKKAGRGGRCTCARSLFRVADRSERAVRHVAGMVVAARRALRRAAWLSLHVAARLMVAAGAALRAPRRSRAGLPVLLRQLHRAQQAHGGRRTTCCPGCSLSTTIGGSSTVCKLNIDPSLDQVKGTSSRSRLIPLRRFSFISSTLISLILILLTDC